jgi:hypothetical protein
MSAPDPSPELAKAPLAWLSVDWVALVIALGLAALVRAGVIGNVVW